MTTNMAEPHFTVKETGDGTPYIIIEPGRGTDANFLAGTIALRLARGTPYAKATDIARYLQLNVESLSYTP